MKPIDAEPLTEAVLIDQRAYLKSAIAQGVTERPNLIGPALAEHDLRQRLRRRELKAISGELARLRGRVVHHRSRRDRRARERVGASA